MGSFIKLNDYVPKISDNEFICFFIGAVAEGKPGKKFL